MSRFQGATYFDMKGGLNTESSPFNIPPSDAIDISNIDINIDGSIERRRGVDVISTELESHITNYATNVDLPTMVQFNPTDDNGNLRKHVVIQLGNRFYIYDYSSPDTLTNLDTPKQVIIASYTDPFTEDPDFFPDIYKTKTIFIADQNKLFIINRFMALSYIYYKPDEDEFELVNKPAMFRELGETSSELKPIANPSKGWPAGCLAVSRLWLAGIDTQPNTLYFSQTIIEGKHHEKMYQEADPFNPLDNILVDTDGGSITITGAEEILAVAPFAAGIIVFANNGVWSIGGQNGFRPTAYNINKISDEGIVGREGWAAVDTHLVYFGQTEIYIIAPGENIDTPRVQTIGEKVVSFYNNIPRYNRKNGKAIYLPDIKKLYFLTNFKAYEWHTHSPYGVHYRDALVLDVRLNAWTKFSLSDEPLNDGVSQPKLSIADIVMFDNGITDIRPVTDGNDFVFDSSQQVTSQDPAATGVSFVPYILFINKYEITQIPDPWIRYQVYLGELRSSGVVDFPSKIDFTENNPSYITIAHQVFGDVAHKKFLPYLIPLFKRMESGIVDENGVDITPGGCKYRVDWDWATGASNKKFGQLYDAYKPYKWTTSMYDGVDPDIEIVSSKLKVRGRGDVFRLHFESDGTKDFKLYGWQLLLAAKRGV